MTKLIMKQHELRMTHWNCRSVMPQREAGAALKLASVRKLSWSSDIVILTETWLKPGREFEIEGFEIIRKDRENKRGGGVAILIRNGLRYECISEICCGDHNTEFLAIKVIGEISDIVIAACYRPPGKPLPLQEWKDFFKQFKDCGSFVLAGDFNAHHPMWNCEKAKPDGNKLLKVIKYYNCKVHNTKHRSHVENKKCPASNLDLIITDSDLAGRVTTRQFDDTMGSDHFPIECVIDFEYLIEDEFYPRYD